MQLPRDNLTLWTSDQSDQGGDGTHIRDVDGGDGSTNQDG